MFVFYCPRLPLSDEHVDDDYDDDVPVHHVTNPQHVNVQFAKIIMTYRFLNLFCELYLLLRRRLIC